MSEIAHDVPGEPAGSKLMVNLRVDIDIEGKTMKSHPAPDSDADGRNFLGADPNAGETFVPIGSDTQGLNGFHEGLLNKSQVGVEITIVSFQFPQPVSNDLSGAMISDLATSTDGDNWDLGIFGKTLGCRGSASGEDR